MSSIPPSNEPSESQLPLLPTRLPGPPTEELTYTQLTTYPFFADNEFLAGLSAILGHPDQPATPEELRENSQLVLQARCFYLTRRFGIDPPIDPAKYLEWTQSSRGAQTATQEDSDRPQLSSSTATAAADLNIPQTQEQPQQQPQQQDPPYPTSFAAIVDLITRNEPIPGIEEIPTTVLEPGTSKIDKTPRRKKPWEKDDESDNGNTAAQDTVQPSNSRAESREEGGGELPALAADRGNAPMSSAASTTNNNSSGNLEGVVKILQPNAIPASGLLSK